MAWSTRLQAGELLDTHHIGVGGAGGFVIDIVKTAPNPLLKVAGLRPKGTVPSDLLGNIS
ncbi:hypothetical protein [Aeromonas veronii]|uniref:hypothetical protein n=1 Tax=Aeromonas veronii TaxID=654 RepID=UPI0040553E6D